LIVDDEPLDFSQAPERWADLFRLAQARQQNPNAGFRRLTKPRRQKLYAALNARRSGLGTDLIEGRPSIGVRLSVVPTIA
jgi:hypothetical protein